MVSINTVIKEQNIQEIICTGIPFLKGLLKTNLPIVTIVFDPTEVQLAKDLATRHANIRVEHGLAINQSEVYNYLLEKKENIILNAIYSYNISKSDIILNLIKNSKKQLIFLGSVSWLKELEFKKIMELGPSFLTKKVIILPHIKDKIC